MSLTFAERRAIEQRAERPVNLFLYWSLFLSILIILAVKQFNLKIPVDNTNEAIGGVVVSNTAPPKPKPKTIFNTVFNNKNLHCLSDAIFHEAGVDTLEGKEAVAIVILNRMMKRNTTDVCSVVSESKMVNGKRVCQFTYYCNSNRKLPHDGVLWADSVLVAVLTLHNKFTDKLIASVGTATHYHADYIQAPSWTANLHFLGKIDTHLFYREVRKHADNQ